jgi:hypothetical protein
MDPDPGGPKTWIRIRNTADKCHKTVLVVTADLYSVAAHEQRPANWEILVDPGAAVPPAAGGSPGQKRQESALHQAPGKSFYYLFYTRFGVGGAGRGLVVISVVDPDSLNTDLDPAFQVNPDLGFDDQKNTGEKIFYLFFFIEKMLFTYPWPP